MIRRDTRATFEWYERDAWGNVDNQAEDSVGCLVGLIGLVLGLVWSWNNKNASVGSVCEISLLLGFIGFVAGRGIRKLLSKKRYYVLCSGKYRSAPIEEAAYRRLQVKQQEIPCRIMRADGRTWWYFLGEIYWENEGLSEIEVKALILERERRKARRIQRALTRMNLEEAAPITKREPIPDEVKIFVWQRDGGRCVRCGSRERLEFDHIIPLSMGGSNTARNIQLLCEACNRSKGDSLV